MGKIQSKADKAAKKARRAEQQKAEANKRATASQATPISSKAAVSTEEVAEYTPAGQEVQKVAITKEIKPSKIKVDDIIQASSITDGLKKYVVETGEGVKNFINSGVVVHHTIRNEKLNFSTLLVEDTETKEAFTVIYYKPSQQLPIGARVMFIVYVHMHKVCAKDVIVIGIDESIDSFQHQLEKYPTLYRMSFATLISGIANAENPDTVLALLADLVIGKIGTDIILRQPLKF